MLKWLDNLLANKINTLCDTACEKILNGACVLVIKIIKGIIYIALQFNDVFVIIAMIGVFFIIVGNRKLGTKITSLSILIYTILRVVASKC